jgi:hypothetical protein
MSCAFSTVRAFRPQREYRLAHVSADGAEWLPVRQTPVHLAGGLLATAWAAPDGRPGRSRGSQPADRPRPSPGEDQRETRQPGVSAASAVVMPGR